ncbi:MAG TPA: TIGR03668 family PPOX class F420-dependent oxidoreductase [Actinomycetales bacterium]|nr:TIGR03668 family PPOX class F420-dependent oxidoreductase [Actinomycetales bacterium]
MDAAECRRRFASARHAYLATSGEDRQPHLVPVVFDLSGDEIALAVDAKPKRSTDLRRLRNIAANPAVCFLVDHYTDDWPALWWVRADARAAVVEDGPARSAALDRLQRRYEQYRMARPAGPVVLATVQRWSGWTAR